MRSFYPGVNNIPHRLIQVRPHKPAKQNAVGDLFDQQPLAAYRIHHLQQLRPLQFLRWNRRPARRGIRRIKPFRQVPKRQACHGTNRLQRIVPPYSPFGRKVAEHVRLLMILPRRHIRRSVDFVGNPFRWVFPQPVRRDLVDVAHIKVAFLQAIVGTFLRGAFWLLLSRRQLTV